MRILNIILLLTFISCQSQNCNCEGFIDWESDKLIKVYSDSDGIEQIAELRNDKENEDFLMFRILESKNGFFKVKIGRAMSENRISGWIQKEKELGIYDRNYSENETLNLYTKPNINSKTKSKVTEYNINLYTIIDCEKDWVYVKRKTENKVYEGWLEPSMQCASPYTTCNWKKASAQHCIKIMLN